MSVSGLFSEPSFATSALKVLKNFTLFWCTLILNSNPLLTTIPRYLYSATHWIGAPYKSSNSGTITLCLAPIRKDAHLDTLNFKFISRNSSSHKLTKFWSNCTEGDIRIMSSAYIMALMNSPQRLHPKSVSFSLTNASSTYKEKRMGDKTPPCLTPCDTRNILDIELPHLTQQKHLVYQLTNNLIRQIGTLLFNSFLNKT